MTTNYPSSLDTTLELKTNALDSTISSLTHPGAHNNVADAIKAIETELGIAPSGADTDVLTRLAGIVSKTPTSDQTIQPSGDFIALILRGNAAQSVARLMEIQSSGGSTLGYWNHSGYLSAASFKVNGVALASTHLADTANILLNPSPSITSPTISSPTLTGTPIAPTAAVDTNTTQVATTAYVKAQNYIPLDSPTLTGVPTAPTPSVNDNSTKIATTAFVISQIAEQSASAEPVGSIVAYGNTTPPSGWLVCDGSAVSKTTYADLFAEIGVTFGDPGGGNFNLPDLRGRMPISEGDHTDLDVVGENEGTAVASRRPKHDHSFSLSANGSNHSHSYTSSTDGSHSHSVTASSGSTGGGSIPDAGIPQYTSGSTGSTGSHSHSVTINVNGGHSHSLSGGVGISGMTDQPAFLVVQYIIKAEQS